MLLLLCAAAGYRQSVAGRNEKKNECRGRKRAETSCVVGFVCSHGGTEEMLLAVRIRKEQLGKCQGNWKVFMPLGGVATSHKGVDHEATEADGTSGDM